jgi:hypothetical protein
MLQIFLSFSTPNISANLSGVGVSLGNSEREIVVATKAPRRIEFDRFKFTLKVSNKSDITLIDDEEELHANTNGQLLSHLVGEVSEVDLDVVMVGSIYDLKASSQKSRSSSTKKNLQHVKEYQVVKISNFFQINGMFKNSRDLLDLSSHLHIVACIWEYCLDVVAISETCRRDYSPSILNCLSGGADFTWVSHPLCGLFGGLLPRYREDTIDVLAISDGDFHIKINIYNKTDNFTWSLVAAYVAT